MMSRIVSKFLLVVIFISGCTGKQVTSTKSLENKRIGEVTLLYQANRFGVLEPCGCSISPFGGIDREANAVEQIRKQNRNIIYVDAGNLFMRPNELVAHKQARLQAKSELIVKIMNEIGLSVYQPGVADYQLGVDFLKHLEQASKFTFVSTNVVGADGNPLWHPYEIIEKGGLRYAVIGLLPESVPGLTVKPVKEALDRWLPEVMAKSDLVVLLSQLPTNAVPSDPRVAVVVGSDSLAIFDSAKLFNGQKTLLVDNEDQGYRLGQLNLTIETPFVGFNSLGAIEEQQVILEKLQKEAKLHPNNKDLSTSLKNFQEQPLVKIIDGGSWFTGSLIPLDKKRFGGRNKVTILKEQDKKALREKAISE